MQSVAEFMEQRPGVIKAEQGGLAFCEVIVIDDDRRHYAVRAFLIAVAARPGARSLAWAGEIVVQKKSDMGAGPVPNLPDPHIKMIDRDVGALDKAEAE